MERDFSIFRLDFLYRNQRYAFVMRYRIALNLPEKSFPAANPLRLANDLVCFVLLVRSTFRA